MEAYFLHLLTLFGIYIVIVQSLDLLAGYTGLLSISHAAFLGIGGYSIAILCGKMGFSYLVAMLAGAIIALFLGLLVGIPSLRLTGDYFVIATFFLQVLWFNILNNIPEITSGPLGITNVPEFPFVKEPKQLTAFVLIIAIAVSVFKALFVNFPIGRILKCIREDEILVQALGRHPSHYKLIVFAISAVIASFAGAIYASYMSYIDPSSFGVMNSIIFLCGVIIGGAGSTYGPILGAIFLIGMPELLRFLGLPDQFAANAKEIIYGVTLILILMFRPQGIVGGFSFDVREKTRL